MAIITSQEAEEPLDFGPFAFGKFALFEERVEFHPRLYRFGGLNLDTAP